MVHNILELKSSARLLSQLSAAAARPLTSDELFEQRVSFVFGSMDSKSNITRDKVKQVIRQQDGSKGSAK